MSQYKPTDCQVCGEDLAVMGCVFASFPVGDVERRCHSECMDKKDIVALCQDCGTLIYMNEIHAIKKEKDSHGWTTHEYWCRKCAF